MVKQAAIWVAGLDGASAFKGKIFKPGHCAIDCERPIQFLGQVRSGNIQAVPVKEFAPAAWSQPLTGCANLVNKRHCGFLSRRTRRESCAASYSANLLGRMRRSNS